MQLLCLQTVLLTLSKVLAREVHINDAQWPNDAVGEVTARRTLGNGTLSVAVRQAESEIWIRGLNPNPERHPALRGLELGQRIGVFNLRVSRHGGTPVENAYTTIYAER